VSPSYTFAACPAVTATGRQSPRSTASGSTRRRSFRSWRNAADAGHPKNDTDDPVRVEAGRPYAGRSSSVRVVASSLTMSNADITIALMLRKPAANERRIAHVRSSLVGCSPPRAHGVDEQHRQHGRHDLVHEQDGRSGGLRHAMDAQSAVHVRRDEDQAQPGEERPGPDDFQGDQGEREAEGDRERDQGDPGADPKVGLEAPRTRSHRRKPVSTQKKTPTRNRPVSVAETSAMLRRNASETCFIQKA
jgi:hypothetical protein